MLIFDCETGSLPDEILCRFLPPFEPSPHPGEFDPGSVRMGNIKDEAKKAAKLADCQAAHAAAVENYNSTVEEQKVVHWMEFKEKAALDPTTGQVLAIGYYSATKEKFSISHGDEPAILKSFWEAYQNMRKSGRNIVGCNSNGFDLPFLIRRSWINQVEIPSTVRKGRYFDDLFVDIRDIWLCGQSWGNCSSSLDIIARALGVGQKPEGVGGEDFAGLWNGMAEEREKAVEYLRNDVDMTYRAAVRLGVV